MFASLQPQSYLFTIDENETLFDGRTIQTPTGCRRRLLVFAGYALPFFSSFNAVARCNLKFTVGVDTLIYK